MADIAQILMLPPPTVRPPATDRALTPQNNPGAEDGSSQVSSQDQGRARRFRFRVYEGGETSDPGTELSTRRTGGQAPVNASQIDLGNSDSLESQGGAGGRNATLFKQNGGGSSAFLAQSIAQEQLGEGLYNPPFAAASAAYTRSGAATTPRASAGLDISA